MSEANSLIVRSKDEILARPRSFRWQICQAMQYTIGSFCFAVGSCLYFTDIFHAYPNVLSASGWLFTIGSSIYLFADLQDWWDYRTGYCFDYQRPSTLDFSLHSLNVSTLVADASVREIEWNVYGYICGSALYLAGSILFLPVFENYLPMGEWFFIFGSTFCYVSAFWKVYRSALDPSSQTFRLCNLLKEKFIFTMDLCTIIGNLSFFIGTIFFLPYIDKTDADENRAVAFFVFGSLCFVLSSFVLQYTICSSRRRSTRA